MNGILKTAREQVLEGQPCLLATILRSQGSSPRRQAP